MSIKGSGDEKDGSRIDKLSPRETRKGREFATAALYLAGLGESI